ncbi:MAG: cyclic nucleotide-binding domain-containing protein [Opitutaceae bacterium]|nr:cyclic nucleotide-binding domain-containing protein [Opitutaceae bacterium]
MPAPKTVKAPSGLRAADLRALEPAAKPRTFAPGQVIFTAGDAGDGCYLVASGRVEISAAVGPGESRVLACIGPGDFFGEMAVIDDAPRSATATAEVSTRALFIARQDLLDLLERQPGLALRIIREFSARMRSLNERYVEEIRQAERLAVVGRFATSIVHDFKNPLAIIGLATDLACSRGSRWTERRQMRTMVSRQTQRMHSMLQELIDFARPGGQHPKLRPVRFAPYLNSLAEEVSPQLAQRGVKLVVETPPRVPVRMEPQRLSRLFYNLLSNAADEMKDGGTITLRFKKHSRELLIEVQDEGQGIAPEFVDSLFKPFATHGKPHGTGLGLTICRRIAEDLGGRIWATSIPGKGATFAFTLRLANQATSRRL